MGIATQVGKTYLRNLGSLVGLRRSRNGHSMMNSDLDIQAIRKHFLFPHSGRIVTNNAATTQVPTDLLRLQAVLAEDYENVHRGQSVASKKMTGLFEEAYDTIAAFLNAPGGKKSVVLYRNTTEAINSVMYSMMTEFRDGDNVVTTMMEHNSNYVPWYAMCREILPRFGIRVECRIVNFSVESGELDRRHLAQLVDNRTKLVCCTGASNFLGTKNPLREIRELSLRSGYVQPDGTRGSYFLVDGAQLVPGAPVDVRSLDVDFLAFSFHKMLAPFGTGVLYAKYRLLEEMEPFLVGGDTVANSTYDSCEFLPPPEKFEAGLQDYAGIIGLGKAVEYLEKIGFDAIQKQETLLNEAITEGIMSIDGLKIIGPADPRLRGGIVTFYIEGIDSHRIALMLDQMANIMVRSGQHCVHSWFNAHQVRGSVRVSTYFYNTLEETQLFIDNLKKIRKVL